MPRQQPIEKFMVRFWDQLTSTQRNTLTREAAKAGIAIVWLSMTGNPTATSLAANSVQCVIVGLDGNYLQSICQFDGMDLSIFRYELDIDSLTDDLGLDTSTPLDKIVDADGCVRYADQKPSISETEMAKMLKLEFPTPRKPRTRKKK